MKKNQQETRVEMITLKDIKNLCLEFHPQNRAISHAHVNQIKEFILSNRETALSHMGTIIVSIKTRNQIDGQHRVQACMELLDENKLSATDKLPMQWIWCSDEAEEYEEIKRFNNTGKRWTSWDYFRGNKMVNENYRRLEAFIKECPKLRGKNSTRPAYALLFGNYAGAQYRFLYDYRACRGAGHDRDLRETPGTQRLYSTVYRRRKQI